MDNSILIQELTGSFSKQLTLYRELEELNNALLSQVVLSRGDITSAIPQFERKQKLLEQISGERDRISDKITLWMERKKDVARSPEAVELNTMLDKVEQSIHSFLGIEDQLKKHLEHIVQQKESSSQ